MKTLTKLIVTTALLLCTALFMSAQTSMDYNIFIEDIEFQPGVTIDINVNVYVNENATNWANHGKIFAIEGMAHTANCLKPLAEELFLNPHQMEINEFFAIDMPGRGGSGLPEGLNSLGQPFLLDQMYIEDYLAVIEGAVRYLNDALNVHPTTIMGHSLGGLEVILLQQKLIDEGTNLRKAYGFKNAVLLAPGMPAPLDWAYINGGGSSGLYDYIDYFTPEYGTVLNLPYYVWPFAFFTNTCCYLGPAMVPGAPTPAEVLANGYASIKPAPLLLQISGSPIPPGLPYPYKPRCEADPNIFKAKNGVQLSIVSDEFDKMMAPSEEMALYEYLTGDNKHKRLFEVTGDETCHDTHISDPHAYAELLATPGIFKSSSIDEEERFAKALNIYPNPVSSEVNINFTLESDQQVTIEVIDAVGKVSKILVNKLMSAGTITLTADLKDLPGGIYFYRIQTGNERMTKKIIKTQ